MKSEFREELTSYSVRDNLMRFFWMGLIFISGLGITTCLAFQLPAIFGIEVGVIQKVFVPLIFTMFFAFFFSTILMGRMTNNFSNDEMVKAAFRGLPKGFQWLRAFSMIYFFVSMGLAMMLGSGGSETSLDRQLMCGLMAAFFLVSFLVFFSRLNLKFSEISPKCVNGHPVSSFSKFCQKCGVPLSSECEDSEKK